MAFKIARALKVEGCVYTNDDDDELFCAARRLIFDLMRNVYYYKGRDVYTICHKRRQVACQFSGVVSDKDYLQLASILLHFDSELTIVNKLYGDEIEAEARAYAERKAAYKEELKQYCRAHNIKGVVIDD